MLAAALANKVRNGNLEGILTIGKYYLNNKDDKKTLESYKTNECGRVFVGDLTGDNFSLKRGEVSILRNKPSSCPSFTGTSEMPIQRCQ